MAADSELGASSSDRSCSDSDQEEPVSPEEEDTITTLEEVEADRVEISLNSVVGLTTPHTTKLRGNHS